MSIERESLIAIKIDASSLIKAPAYKLAWMDIKESFQKWRIWIMLAYQDILLRYRRSILGPFWLTLSMAITVYTMGFLYAHIFHIEMQRYYPFLVAGMLAWTLISTLIIECTDVLILSDALIKQIKLPYTLYMHRLAARNIIIFFHNIVVILPVLAVFHDYAKINFYTLLLIPGLLLIYLNTLTYGLMLAMVGARYRDVSQVIKSLTQIIFFITPVLWGPDILGANNHYFIDFNPFYSFIELIRSPLLGTAPTFKNMVMVSVVTVFGLFAVLRFFVRYRSRIVYWL